jgi:hypothetical protein
MPGSAVIVEVPDIAAFNVNHCKSHIPTLTASFIFDSSASIVFHFWRAMKFKSKRYH